MSRMLAQLVPATELRPRDVVHVLARAEVHTVTRTTSTASGVQVHFAHMGRITYGPAELVAIVPRPRRVAIYRATWEDGHEDDADSMLTLSEEHTEGVEFGEGPDMIDEVILILRDAGVSFSNDVDPMSLVQAGGPVRDADGTWSEVATELFDFSDDEVARIRYSL